LTQYALDRLSKETRLIVTRYYYAYRSWLHGMLISKIFRVGYVANRATALCLLDSAEANHKIPALQPRTRIATLRKV
jgi:hypothetical protein